MVITFTFLIIIMISTLKYKKEKAWSRGRKLSIITTGLELMSVGHTVYITPITSKGCISNACNIGIPIGEVKELIEKLQDLIK